MNLPEIPHSYLVAGLIIMLTLMRCFGVDSFVTAGLGSLIGYVLGKHIEQAKRAKP
jgi:hypothetical protein